MNHGDLLSVVVEFDGSGRLGADSAQISRMALGNISQVLHPSGGLYTTSFPVAASQGRNIVVLEFSDTSLGTLDHAHICSGTTANNIHTGTTPDEVAIKWTPPFSGKVSGMWCQVQTGNNARDFDMVLYEGTTQKQLSSMDANIMSTDERLAFRMWPETDFTSGTAIYGAIKPTTGNSIGVLAFDVANAAHFDLQECGQAMHFASRTDAGAWTAVTTRRLNAGFLITAQDFPSGGGGMAANPLRGLIG